MKTIETDVVVGRDGMARIDLKLPADVIPGRHRVVLVLDDRAMPSADAASRSLLDFPIHDFGPWPEGLSLRRADLYGEDER